MKRLTILAIIACLGLLFAPAAVLGAPVGPPGGLDVKIVAPIPVPVEGDMNATVTGEVNVTNTPNVNVVNDEANPIPVKVINGGQLVIIREGYTVPLGKTLRIVDISVQCNMIGPDPFDGASAGLNWNLQATPALRINYPKGNQELCPEPIPEPPPDDYCPVQDIVLGLAGGYAVSFVTNDNRPVIIMHAGRQVNIIADQGATLTGSCPGGTQGTLYNAFIAAGQGYLNDRP